MKPVRLAVIGAGSFGRNHLRVLRAMEGVELTAVVDADAERAAQAAVEFGCQACSLAELDVDGAVVATPTVTHAGIGCQLLARGIDVLVEKPVASTLVGAQSLIDTAASHNRILQVGHLERFNPAVAALGKIVSHPLFFEVHRLSLFSPRSLDVDVVLDLMIHDLDIVLTLAGCMPEEIRAAGISILSSKVDIANVRLAFPGGCVANLTASRVSTERVRKIRLFQPREYLSLDYARQDLVAFAVSPENQIEFRPVEIHKDEPLKLELAAFVDSIRTRRAPQVGGGEGLRALQVALEILDRIEAHGRTVADSIAALK